MSSNIFYFKYNLQGLLLLFFLFTGCEPDEDNLEPAAFPSDPEVFIETFSSGLEYAAFGGSVNTAFQVDNIETFDNSRSSMRFAVPDAGDPLGAYAGGTFFTPGRDLSGYDALTFYAKASKAATIDIIGFGNDLGLNQYQTALLNTPITTNWKKYIIPIPDPSKLTSEKGMLFYSEGPEEGRGYTFWLDEVQFERLGTLSYPRPGVLDGVDEVSEAETGETFNMGPLFMLNNLPTGIDQRIELTSAFFSFESSDPTVAKVDDAGTVTVVDSGMAVITASISGIDAIGSLTINSAGEPILPESPAPEPPYAGEDVISIFSDEYNDVPVDFYNGFWQFSTTQSDIVEVEQDNIIRYTQLNFVGIQFTAPEVDASGMSHFHMDIWTPDPITGGSEFKILLVDRGPDNILGNEDDSSHELTIPGSNLSSMNWISLDFPFTQFAGLTNRSNLVQIVLSGNLPNIFADNIYFYDDGSMATEPTEAAPTPTRPAANVISVFSDAYSDVVGTDFNPDWGQATVVSQTSIQGNNTLLYTGLNYQGTQLASSLDVTGMTHLHLDYWTSNSSMLNVFLISSGPVEESSSLSVPTSGEWRSIDISLSSFTPVDLADIIQLKFEGNGNIYLDNIYFYN